MKWTLSKGTLLFWQGKVVSYEASLSIDKVQIYDRVGKTYHSVNISDVELLDQGQIRSSEPAPASEYTSEKQEDELILASSRFDVIKEFIESGRQIKQEIEELSNKLSVSHSYCYKLFQLYDAEEGPVSLLRFKRGAKSGSVKISSKVEAIINDAITTAWTGPGARTAKVFEQVCQVCRAAGETAPALDTIMRRIKSKDQYELAVRKQGKKAASDIYEARPGKVDVKRPHELWQMDHTVIDCIIVDEKNRQPLCRPWVTLIIDIYTRIVVGFYLSIHSPNSLSVAMAISHAVLPKKDWLKLLGVEDIRYPFFGKPEMIQMDNAKEFTSKTLRAACAKHNIQPKWRRVRKPHWGGHIERLNGTLQMGYVHYLPGTTLSNVKMKGDYDSEKEAVLTFAELRVWFTRAIEIYHKKTHRMIGMSPQQRWIDYYTDKNGVLNHPSLIKNPTDFFIDFLPCEERVVRPKGILIHNIFYYSSALKSFIGRLGKVPIKYNPQSLRKIWVEVEPGRYVEVPYANRLLPDISLGEYKTARKQIAKTEHERVAASDVFSQIDKNRMLVEDSKIKTKRARKFNEQSKLQRHDLSFQPIEVAGDGLNSNELDYDLPVNPSKSYE